MMQVGRHRLVGIALSLALFVSCSGCAGDVAGRLSSFKREREADREPVVLTTVSMFAGTDSNAEIYQAISREFMDQYPYITIEDDSTISNEDWKKKISADFAVGNEPDVLQFFTDANAADILLTDKFVTVEEVQEQYPDYARNTWAKALDQAAAEDGTHYAVPMTGYWEGLYCNVDLFDRYGVEFLRIRKLFPMRSRFLCFGRNRRL